MDVQISICVKLGKGLRNLSQRTGQDRTDKTDKADQTDQTDLTGRQADKHTGRQADRRTDGQTDRQTDMHQMSACTDSRSLSIFFFDFATKCRTGI